MKLIQTISTTTGPTTNPADAGPPKYETTAGKLSARLVPAIAVTLILGAALTAAPIHATPPSGVVIKPLAPVGGFGEIDAFAKINDWHAKLKTKGGTDLYVVEVTIQPGGTLGWHSHPGISFVIVKSGAATFYQADDATCTPNVLRAGSTLFEAAGDVHLVRNEGTEPLVNLVIQLVPTGGARLISEPNPGHCPTLN